MGRRSFTGGISSLIIGFIVYQFGLLIVIRHPAFLTTEGLLLFLPPSVVDVIGMLLILVGGIISILGLVRLTRSLSDAVFSQRYEAVQEISNLRSSLSQMLAMMVSRPTRNEEEKTTSEKECRFCGSLIKQGLVFCPSCGRSQN